jgi:hypothetical protein
MAAEFGGTQPSQVAVPVRDNGLLAPELAQAISRVKSVKSAIPSGHRALILDNRGLQRVGKFGA